MSSVQIHTANYRNSKQQDHHRLTSLSNSRRHEANTGMYRVQNSIFGKYYFIDSDGAKYIIHTAGMIIKI